MVECWWHSLDSAHCLVFSFLSSIFVLCLLCWLPSLSLMSLICFDSVSRATEITHDKVENSPIIALPALVAWLWRSGFQYLQLEVTDSENKTGVCVCVRACHVGTSICMYANMCLCNRVCGMCAQMCLHVAVVYVYSSNVYEPWRRVRALEFLRGTQWRNADEDPLVLSLLFEGLDSF